MPVTRPQVIGDDDLIPNLYQCDTQSPFIPHRHDENCLHKVQLSEFFCEEQKHQDRDVCVKSQFEPSTYEQELRLANTMKDHSTALKHRSMDRVVMPELLNLHADEEDTENRL